MWMHGLIGTTRRTCALYHGTNQYTGLIIIIILINYYFYQCGCVIHPRDVITHVKPYPNRQMRNQKAFYRIYEGAGRFLRLGISG